MYQIALHFSGYSNPELYSTNFSDRIRQRRLICSRGKSLGAGDSHGCFQWTRAVQGLSLLFLKTINHGPTSTISGEGGSIASSLDYAISKQPQWLSDMFGLDAQGRCVVQRFICRTNPNRKHSGPVLVGLKPNVIQSKDISIFLNGTLLQDPVSLSLLETNLDTSLRDTLIQLPLAA